MKRFIFYFARDNLQFTLNELMSVASMLGIKVDVIEKGKESPFIVADVASENDVKSIASRSFLLKSSYEYLSDSWSMNELETNTATSPAAKPYINSNESFSIRIRSTGFRQTQKEVLALIDTIVGNILKLQGPVDLTKSTHRFDLLMDHNASNGKPANGKDNVRIFLGRWIAEGQRKLINKYDIKKRFFIANTSMDPLLSFIMANEAQVKKNSLVLDPFVGSGGCLVACAHFGAYVMGTDINYLLLHGRSRPSRVGVSERSIGEGILANMMQYGLQSHFLDCFVADASLLCNVWHCGAGLFDAIVTDPPYGVRESGRRLGSEEPYEITDELRGGHIPSKICYGFVDVYADLLNMAAFLLRVGGRLVFWLPSLAPPDFKESHVPRHPSLELVSHEAEGTRISTVCRRLVAMQKIRDPLPGECAFIEENPFDSKTFRDHVCGSQPSVYLQTNSNIKSNSSAGVNTKLDHVTGNANGGGSKLDRQSEKQHQEAEEKQ